MPTSGQIKELQELRELVAQVAAQYRGPDLASFERIAAKLEAALANIDEPESDEFSGIEDGDEKVEAMQKRLAVLQARPRVGGGVGDSAAIMLKARIAAARDASSASVVYGAPARTNSDLVRDIVDLKNGGRARQPQLTSEQAAALKRREEYMDGFRPEHMRSTSYIRNLPPEWQQQQALAHVLNSGGEV